MTRRLRADRRVAIVSPRPGSTVTGPVVLRWRSTFEPGEASGLWFAVHVDTAMTPPGAVAVAGPGVHVTADHRIDVGTLPAGAGPEHRFSIVLVDADGVRQGDVAWTASFRTGPAPSSGSRT